MVSFPTTGIEPTPGQREAQSLNRWTAREVPTPVTFKATSVMASPEEPAPVLRFAIASDLFIFIKTIILYTINGEPGSHSMRLLMVNRIHRIHQYNKQKHTTIKLSVCPQIILESFSCLAPLAGNALWKTHCLTWMGTGRHLDK